MTFTPGPWRAEGLGGTGIWFVRTNTSQLPFEEAVETVVCDVLDPNPAIGQTTYLPNAEANARLIAAAPDMYNELKQLTVMGLGDTYDRIRALLAKIDGDSSCPCDSGHSERCPDMGMDKKV